MSVCRAIFSSCEKKKNIESFLHHLAVVKYSDIESTTEYDRYN